MEATSLSHDMDGGRRSVYKEGLVEESYLRREEPWMIHCLLLSGRCPPPSCGRIDKQSSHARAIVVGSAAKEVPTETLKEIISPDRRPFQIQSWTLVRSGVVEPWIVESSFALAFPTPVLATLIDTMIPPASAAAIG
ncbi:MAG: hypothetical protein Q9204_002579 [Flavoplaca sp. TL-2023a]